MRVRNGMWVMVMFDLPVGSAPQRRCYSRFRKFLLRNGFEMRQKSVYLRWDETVSACEATSKSVELQSPPDGRVTVMRLTERTMTKARVLVDRETTQPPTLPDEFLIC